MEEIAKLKAIIGADISDFQSKIGKVGSGIDGVVGQLKGLGGTLAGLGAVGFLTDAIGQFREAAQIGRQLDAVLTSTASAVTKVRVETGGYHEELRKTIKTVDDGTGKHKHKVEVLERVRVANSRLVDMEKSTRESILATSDALMKLTGIDDDVVTATQNVLLTFTKIGKEVMPKAAATTLDMAAAMKMDTKSAAIMIGKALQSADGLTALTRAGVTFTKQEERKIKALFASGKVMDAQKLILAELNREFGGSAAAQADGLTRLQTTWGNFMEQIGGFVMPIIDQLATVFGQVLTAMMPLIPVITPLIVAFAGLALATGPVGAILGAMLGPIGLIVAAAAAVYAAWETNFGGLRDIVTSAWNAVRPGLEAMGNGIRGIIDTIFNPPTSDNYFEQIAPDFQAKTAPIGERIKKAFADFGPKIAEGLKTALTAARDWLSMEGAEFLEYGMKSAISFTADMAAWVQTNAPSIVTGVVSWLHGAVNWLEQNAGREINDAVKQAIQFTGDLTAWLKTNAPDIAYGIGQWIGGAVNWLINEAPAKINDALLSLFGNVKIDPTSLETLGASIGTAFATIFGEKGPIAALFEGAFGLEKGTLGVAITAFFSETGPLQTAINGVVEPIQAAWDSLFGEKGGLMITINTLKGLVEGVFTTLRASVMNILKTLLSPLVTLLKAVAIVALAIGNTDLAAQAGKAALDIEGMRAEGGPVQAGKAYMVGEKGPELFRPGSSGHIVPNHDLKGAMPSGGGSGMVFNGAIHIYGVQDVESMYDQLAREARRRNIR